MPRGKKIGRFELRFDQEFAQALETLGEIYPKVTKAELIREAVIEKAKRDASKKPKKPETGS